MSTTLDDAVVRVLGPDASLRPAQRDALAGLREHDTLLVARSGAGKTAVYAVATLVTGRLTVVVSPLLALQRDQAEALRDAGLRAEPLSSALSPTAQRDLVERAGRGDLDVLLLAPEQLAREPVLERLAGADVGLLVVDEAHCVSEWGHDFRPDYLHLAGAAERLGRPRLLALTATASHHVREEIVERLGMTAARVLVHDADRPNIWLGVRTVADSDVLVDAVVEAVTSTQGAGIVYARTRAEVERVAAAVSDAGRRTLAYHAGMAADRRAQVEHLFLSGARDVVVATSAFGMGVDRGDVRFVVHAGPPPSLDAYYQEVGRAGRDGEPAIALLVHHPGDTALNRYLRGAAGPRPATLGAVLDAVPDDGARVPRSDVAARSGVASRTVSRALTTLRDVGAVTEDPQGWARAPETDPVRALTRIAEERERRKALERSRVEIVRTYAETADCRRRVLLELLGEHHPQRCGHCDSCDVGTSADAGHATLRPGQRVHHAEWGEGTVSVVESDRATVLFADRGYTTLDLAVALDSGVLRPST